MDRITFLEVENELEKALLDYEEKFNESYSIIESDLTDEEIIKDIYKCIKNNKRKEYEKIEGNYKI